MIQWAIKGASTVLRENKGQSQNPNIQEAKEKINEARKAKIGLDQVTDGAIKHLEGEVADKVKEVAIKKLGESKNPLLRATGEMIARSGGKKSTRRSARRSTRKISNVTVENKLFF